MSRALIQKLSSVLDSVLKKLSRYDEGSFFAQILSLTVRFTFDQRLLYLCLSQKPINEDGQAYVSCVNANLEQMRQKISDEIFTLNIFEVKISSMVGELRFSPMIRSQEWYRQQTQYIFQWLSERTEIGLHPYQLACLLLIVKVRSMALTDRQREGVFLENSRKLRTARRTREGSQLSNVWQCDAKITCE